MRKYTYFSVKRTLITTRRLTPGYRGLPESVRYVGHWSELRIRQWGSSFTATVTHNFQKPLKFYLYLYWYSKQDLVWTLSIFLYQSTKPLFHLLGNIYENHVIWSKVSEYLLSGHWSEIILSTAVPKRKNTFWNCVFKHDCKQINHTLIRFLKQYKNTFSMIY